MFETIFAIVLVGATLLVALTAGFQFTFAVITMPGLRNLNDNEFIRAFQEIARVIRSNHPFFMLVWVGSTVLLMAAAGIGFVHLESLQRNLLLASTVLYIIGVKAPTIVLNIPNNDVIQTIKVDTTNAETLRQARIDFEDNFNRSNQFRTAMSIIVTVILLSLIYWL